MSLFLFFMQSVSRSILGVFICLLVLFFVLPQHGAAQSACKRGRNLNLGTIGVSTLSTGNTGTGNNINVIYHRCNWTTSPDDATKTLKGSVTTHFITTEPNVTSISFDFNSTSFNNDSLRVNYHGSICNFSFPTSGYTDILNINLPASLVNTGTLDSVTINYKGIPPSASGQAVGFQRDVDGANNNYIYTLSESYEDKDWWPCKADMQDKIDSIDINVTVPNNFWVAANGIMIDSAINGGNRSFKFKHRYPIASYLVALGIAKYKRFNLGNLNVGTKNVPFILNFFSGKSAALENNILGVMNDNKAVFDTFNVLYGDYPYANEKTGFYEFGFGGGMEHQTFSGVDGNSLQDNSTLAHELGHQWWGDKVTFATWKDLWLAEGFATYGEVLASEFVPALGTNWVTMLRGYKTAARNNTSTAIYLSDISNSDAVWKSNNVSAVYDRGCMVASMLRALLGNEKYFTACKYYLNDTAIAYKSATTSDLQRHMQAQFGENMSNFFNEWIYKKGSPRYTINWGNVAKKINIKLSQTVVSSGTVGTASTFFPMPVVLKIQDTINGLDTTVVIYHKAIDTLIFSGKGIGSFVIGNTISYQLSFTPNKILFDPQSKTMAVGTVSYSAILPVYDIEFFSKKIQNKNLLEISIFSDHNIDRVELQSSTDGINFTTLGLMQSIAANAKSKQFELTDENITFSGIYYRAKVFSMDKSIFSKVIYVDNKANSNRILVSPNPAENFVNVYFENNKNISTILQLVKIDGKVLQQQNTTNNFARFETTNIAKGIYYIRIYQNSKFIGTEKLIVKGVLR